MKAPSSWIATGCYKRRVSHAPRAAALALGVFVAGCGVPSRASFDSGGVAPRVQLGTGTASFVELPPSGGRVELVHGPQGGYHIDLTTRIWGLDPERLQLTYRVVRRSDGSVLSVTTYLLSAGRVLREGDHLLRAGDIAVLSITGPMDVVPGEVELSVQARARDGTVASDIRFAFIVDDIP
jgi:hypothetical protein